uniref:Importin-4 n=1 Tax=Bursaphelenchus xylophilus TaxID=6326 RepID=A0A1I7S0C8_BURXY
MADPAFQKIVANLLGSQNELRLGAEKVYDQIPVDVRCKELWKLYQDTNLDVERRSFGLVLLRQLLSSHHDELWRLLGEDGKQKFFENTTQYLLNEPDSTLRKKLADVTAELAQTTLDHDTGKQEWSGAIQLLEYCVASNSEELFEVGMNLIEDVPNILGVDQDQYLEGISKLFHLSFASSSLSVKLSAVRAYAAFLAENADDEDIVQAFSDLIPSVIEVCQQVVASDEEDDSSFQCLGDLISAIPKQITPHLDGISELCLGTIKSEGRDESLKHSALEVMVCLCESTPTALEQKDANILTVLVQECLKMMTDISYDITDWMEAEDSDDDEDEENYIVGELSLTRICASVGGVVQPILEAISEMVKQADWRFRFAAFMALAAIGEDCKHDLEPIIPKIIDELVLPCSQDSHPRVRVAVCRCLNQMATDFAPTLHMKSHSRILPILLGYLDDLSSPRIVANSAAALENFVDNSPKKVMAVYLSLIMEKLELVLQHTFKNSLENGKNSLLEQVISTIGVVAENAGKSFSQYYARTTEPLKFIIANANNEEAKSLRSQALDTFTTILLAAGKWLFTVTLTMSLHGFRPNRSLKRKSIEEESNLEVLAFKLNALAELILESGARNFTESEITSIFKTLQSELEAHEERVTELAEDSDNDEDEMEEEYEEMSAIVIKISDIIHALFSTFGEKIVPFFGQMAEKFAALMGKEGSFRDRQCGTCIFADMLEFAGEQAIVQFEEFYLEKLIKNAGDEFPEVRQAANYAIGILAMKGGPQYAQFCAQALEILAQAINLPDARETEDALAATENAVSAVAKILKFNSTAIDANSVIPAFIGWLPIWQDDDEIPYVYSYFCDLVEANNPAVLGANNENLPSVFEIILETFENGAFCSEEQEEELINVKNRLINIVKTLKENEQVFNQVLAAIPLTEEKKLALQEILA